MKYPVIGLSLFIIFACFATPNSFGDEHNYVGVYSCKMCHKSSDSGEYARDPYSSWIHSRHSQAYLSLSTEEQQNNECLECHTTAYGVDSSRIGRRFKIEDGVQCEACHGPGKDYSMVMDDEYTREIGLANGLILPTEEVCIKCHNNRSPQWNPINDPALEEGGARVGFNFEWRKWQIAHKNIQE